MSKIDESNVGELVYFLKGVADEKRSLDARSKDLKDRVKSTAEAYGVEVKFLNSFIKSLIDEEVDFFVDDLDSKSEDARILAGALA